MNFRELLKFNSLTRRRRADFERILAQTPMGHNQTEEA